MSNYRIELNQLNVRNYQTLRSTTSWTALTEETVQKALERDLFSVSIFEGSDIIGMGRVIGDGTIYFYVQDVIVDPEYQNRGIGRLIMEQIESYLHLFEGNYGFVGLMAAKGVKDFYSRLGYNQRPDDGPGMFKVIGTSAHKT